MGTRAASYAMSMLGEQGLLKVELRGEIGTHDVQLVARMRSMRASWAACAKAIGHSEPDTRRVCDPTYAATIPIRAVEPGVTVAEPASAPRMSAGQVHRARPLAMTVAQGTKEHLVLLFLRAGITEVQQLADRIAKPPVNVRSILHVLTQKGFVVHSDRNTWAINQKGRDELDRLAKEADRG